MKMILSMNPNPILLGLNPTTPSTPAFNLRLTHPKLIRLAFLAACSALWLTASVHAQTPTILSAFGEFDSGSSNQFVDVTFSEAMNVSALDPHNYSIAGYKVMDAKYFVNNEGVASSNMLMLLLDKALTGDFTLGVSSVQSASGTPIASDTTFDGTLDPMSSIDLGVFSLTGTTFYEGPGSYLVNASGQDIWEPQDGFRFVYTTRTNNFALVVQVPYILPTDQWSKAGLMARETIDSAANGGDGGSRMVAVFTTPLITQLGLDGTYGENSLSCAVRDTTDQEAYEPDDYIGDGAIVPSYPNQWLMLTRVTEGTNDLFTIYGSTNDADWTWLADFNPTTTGADTNFPSVVFVGLCSSTDIYPPDNQLVTASYQNFGDHVVHVTVINSPTNLTVESGSSATFSVLAASDNTFSRGGATSLFANYQWYTNSFAVPGANASLFTIPLTTTNLSGLKVYCEVSASAPFTGTTNSATATLTVLENPAPPTIVSAFGEYDRGTSNQFVDVTFNEAMNASSLTDPADYSIAGYTITSVMLFTNDLGVPSTNQVILQLSAPLTNGFTLNVSNVQSFSSVTIAADTAAAGTADPMSSIDITSTNAATPTLWYTGTTFYEGPGSYLVDANGQDIWNDQDGFRYVWTTKTNNFAVLVQVPWIIPAAAWSKAGIMAREFIDPSDGGSRMAAVITTPTASQVGINGANGANTLSWQVRDTADAGAYEPGNYIGDGSVTPSYPDQWLMLTRQFEGTNGDVFTAYASTDRLNWVWLGNWNPVIAGEDTPFPSVLNVGMCTSSGWSDSYTNNDAFVTAMYQNFGDYSNHVSLIDSPTNMTVETGTSATFSVLVAADTSLILNGATNPFATYQWYTNSVAVPGANASVYVTPLTTSNLNGEKVYCAISAIGAATPTTNSTQATLTVVQNTTVPTILSAYGEYDSGTALQYVDVSFSEIMDLASILDPANYSITGYTITGVELFTNNLGVGDPTNVVLEVNQQITGNFTLHVTNVQSVSGIPIAAGTPIPTSEDPLSSIDIGVIDFPGAGATYYQAPDSYLVDSSGQDIWNQQDGFRYVYATRTNNFNVVVQVPFMNPADTWSKAGLMARETIDSTDGGSRMIALVTTPAASQLGLDGTYGQNTLQLIVRDTTDNYDYEPGNYIGDYVIAPSFPNQWLLLTRRTDGTNDLFTAYASTNEADWTWVGDFNPVDVGSSNPFPSVVNIGMATSTDIYSSTPPEQLTTALYENFGDYADNVFLTNSPQNQTVESGTSATFSVLVGSDGTVLYNGVTGPFVAYQWYTNGVAVPGATAESYTTPITTTNLNGEMLYCAITAIGATAPTNSAKATLTVLEDSVPPTIVSAFAEYDSGTSNQYVDVTFDKVMNLASLLNPANYSIAGYTITGARLFTNNLGVGSTTMVILQLNKPLTGGFTLDVNNVQSISSIPVAAGTSVTTTADPLASIDIGVFSLPGTTYYEGPGSYLVNSSGQDIWNDQDGFRFVYTTRTNSFDVLVQVPSILPADQWSKAGLMAREKIDPSDGGSRMIAVFTTAAATQAALDGSFGENSLSMAVRDTTDGGAYEPADYVGDGVIAPAYPNQWLRLTRQTDGTSDLFTVYGSTNKVSWTWLGDFNPVTTGAETPFPSVVNVGMCTSAGIDTTNLELPDNNTLLATAMYQNFGDYLQGPILTATLVAVSNSLTISWTPAGGSLYASPVIGSGAAWTLVTASNPAIVPITKTNISMFFKVMSP
jgi:hypothetical protein